MTKMLEFFKVFSLDGIILLVPNGSKRTYWTIQW